MAIWVLRELLKNEIEKVRDDYLDLLYQIIRVFERPASATTSVALQSEQLRVSEERAEWRRFVQRTFGAFADDPIKYEDWQA